MSKNRTILILIFVIVLANVILYAKTAKHEFLNYDDAEYITENPNIKEFNLNGFKRIARATSVGNYQPVVLLSYAAEFAAFGNNPAGFHIVSILLHILNSILVLFLIYMIKKDLTFAFVVTLLFSLHPMHVETVAWASERKGLLCALFYLLSFISYIRSSRGGGKKNYILSVFFFILALLSKPVAVTLPIVLILFDHYDSKITKSTIFAKIPYFALSAAMTLVTIYSQKSSGAIVSSKMTARAMKHFMTGFDNIAFYISKLLVPIRLSPHYFYSMEMSAFIIKNIMAVIVIAALTAYFMKIKRIDKDINFGILFFLISLLPILRFMPLGEMIAADRYVYMPSIGLFFAVTALADRLRKKSESLNKAVAALMVTYLLFFGVSTFRQCDTWRDSKSLWTNVLKYYPDYHNAHLGIGLYHLKRRETVEAREHMNKTIDHEKGRELALYDIGLSYVYENDLKEAKNYFLTLLSEFPKPKNIRKHIKNHGNAYYYLGVYSLSEEKFDKAMLNFEQSLKYMPRNPRALYDYALTLEVAGDMDKAFEHYKLANKYNPAWGKPKEALKRLTGMTAGREK